MNDEALFALYADSEYTRTLRATEIVRAVQTLPIPRLNLNGLFVKCEFTSRQWSEGLISQIFVESLTQLELQDNRLHERDGFAIAEAISNCSSLTYLDLSRNVYLEDTAMERIHKAIADSKIPLKTFICCQTDMRNKAVIALADLVEQSTTLTSLTISATNSQRDACSVLLQKLKLNTTLQELNIEENTRLFLEDINDCFIENRTIVKGSGPHGISRFIAINQLCRELNASEEERRSIPRGVDKPHDIEQFLRELIENGERWDTLKLIFLGNGEIGKTTLLNALKTVQNQEKNEWFNKAYQPVRPSRTVGIDQSVFILAGGEISVWDFGGQIEYTVTHQFFLSNEISN